MKNFKLFLLVLFFLIIGGIYINYRALGREGVESCKVIAREKMNPLHRILAVKADIIYTNDGGRTVEFYTLLGTKLDSIDLGKILCNHFTV